MAIKVEFLGNTQNVLDAVARTNELLAAQSFFARIREHHGFDYSTATPAQIADLMETSDVVVSVKLYTSRWPWSKAVAFEDRRFPNVVFLNTRRLNRSVPSICATIVHECVHAVDSAEAGLRFGHLDNNPNGKENTAPYWIGDLAEEMLSGEAPQFAQLIESMEQEWNVETVV